jgi:hypothetical protein
MDTPVCTPGVFDDPIVLATLDVAHTITDDCDCVVDL